MANNSDKFFSQAVKMVVLLVQYIKLQKDVGFFYRQYICFRKMAFGAVVWQMQKNYYFCGLQTKDAADAVPLTLSDDDYFSSRECSDAGV